MQHADVLIERINKKYVGNLAQVSVDFMAKRIINSINKMPSADVEPVERWISVDERLPEHEGSYLVCTTKSDAFISHYYPQYKQFNGANGHITHWMDRPEPPKMDGGSE